MQESHCIQKYCKDLNFFARNLQDFAEIVFLSTRGSSIQSIPRFFAFLSNISFSRNTLPIENLVRYLVRWKKSLSRETLAPPAIKQRRVVRIIEPQSKVEFYEAIKHRTKIFITFNSVSLVQTVDYMVWKQHMAGYGYQRNQTSLQLFHKLSFDCVECTTLEVAALVVSILLL